MEDLHVSIINRSTLDTVNMLLYNNYCINIQDTTGKYPLQYLFNNDYGQKIKAFVNLLWSEKLLYFPSAENINIYMSSDIDNIVLNDPYINELLSELNENVFLNNYKIIDTI